ITHVTLKTMTAPVPCLLPALVQTWWNQALLLRIRQQGRALPQAGPSTGKQKLAPFDFEPRTLLQLRHLRQPQTFSIKSALRPAWTTSYVCTDRTCADTRRRAWTKIQCANRGTDEDKRRQRNVRLYCFWGRIRRGCGRCPTIGKPAASRAASRG